jgi:hypothetical protein
MPRERKPWRLRAASDQAFAHLCSFSGFVLYIPDRLD